MASVGTALLESPPLQTDASSSAPDAALPEEDILIPGYGFRLQIQI